MEPRMMMDNSTWIAQIIGPVMTIVALWMLTRTDDIKKFWNSVKTTPALFFMGAFLHLLMGTAILVGYHEWVMHISVLVTLVGYLFIIRALLCFFMPDVIMRWTQSALKRLPMLAVFPLVLGLLLTWFGYRG